MHQMPPYAVPVTDAVPNLNPHLGRSSNAIKCGGFLFTSKFDSGNMESVELVEINDPTTASIMRVYRIRVRSDNSSCDYRMRYHFAICCLDDPSGADAFGTLSEPLPPNHTHAAAARSIMIEIVNLNPMLRCYTRNLAPFVATFRSGTHDLNFDPTPHMWSRLNDKTKYSVYTFCNQLHLKMALHLHPGKTYVLTSHLPFSYTSCQRMLDTYQLKYATSSTTNANQSNHANHTSTVNNDTIYFKRELMVYSLEGARVDLVTITSHRGRSNDREPLPATAWRPGQPTKRVGLLFPNRTEPRPHLFKQKKIVFLTGRVHPGETPGSHVLNGLLEFLLDEFDPRAISLRNLFVFKIVPMLNPDGVSLVCFSSFGANCSGHGAPFIHISHISPVSHISYISHISHVSHVSITRLAHLTHLTHLTL